MVYTTTHFMMLGMLKYDGQLGAPACPPAGQQKNGAEERDKKRSKSQLLEAQRWDVHQRRAVLYLRDILYLYFDIFETNSFAPKRGIGNPCLVFGTRLLHPSRLQESLAPIYQPHESAEKTFNRVPCKTCSRKQRNRDSEQNMF